MRFFLVREERPGSGCNYSIGCGIKVEEIVGVATTEEAGRKACEQKVEYEGEPPTGMIDVDPRNERKIWKATIFAVAEVCVLDLVLLERTREWEKEKAAKEEARKRELAEFERLKSKHGG